jgi:hypothetical protein
MRGLFYVPFDSWSLWRVVTSSMRRSQWNRAQWQLWVTSSQKNEGHWPNFPLLQKLIYTKEASRVQRLSVLQRYHIWRYHADHANKKPDVNLMYMSISSYQPLSEFRSWILCLSNATMPLMTPSLPPPIPKGHANLGRREERRTLNYTIT